MTAVCGGGSRGRGRGEEGDREGEREGGGGREGAQLANGERTNGKRTHALGRMENATDHNFVMKQDIEKVFS